MGEEIGRGTGKREARKHERSGRADMGKSSNLTDTVLLLKSFHIRRILFLITGRHYSLHKLTCLYSLFQELPINRNQNLKISTLGYSFLGNCTVEIFWFCQGHFCLYTLVFQCLMIVLLYPSMVFKNHDTIKYHS